MKTTAVLFVALVFGIGLAWAAPEEAGFEDLPAAQAEVVFPATGRELLGGKGHDACYCAAVWWYNGHKYSGCSEVDSPGKPWCVVNPECGKCDGYKGSYKWKYCPKPVTPVPKPEAPKPKPNCDCKPSWVYKGCTYKGCSTIDSKDKPWCIVHDSCDKYDGYTKGQKWKYCPKPAATCTCLPVWWYKNCEYKGCSTVDSHDKPWCFVNHDCPYPDGYAEGKKYKYCPKPEAPKPPPVTCKCQEHYWYKNCQYSGCIVVDSKWGKPWCIVNDDCPKWDGILGGDKKGHSGYGKKWMWCKDDKKH